MISSVNYTVSTQYRVLSLALSALFWQMGGIHVIQEFPDILRSARCVYQTQTVWDGSLDTIKVEKVSVMYGTLLGRALYL